MSFLDELRSSRETPTTAYHLFLLNHPKGTGAVHAFFEGNDDSSFYLNFLNHYTEDRYQLFIYKCGNKKSVYETYEKIYAHGFPEFILLFFVDKDLYNFLDIKTPVSDNIFVTDYYSIENYLVNDYSLQRIWFDILHLPNQDGQFEIVRAKFIAELRKFYEIFQPIMCWIIYTMRCNLKPNFNNINVTKLLIFDDQLELNILPDNILAELEKCCGINTPENFENEVGEIKREIEKHDPKMYVRGKFELWFLVKFVEKLIPIIRNCYQNEGEKIKVVTVITEENAIEILGPRIPIPQTLSSFLSSHLTNH